MKKPQNIILAFIALSAFCLFFLILTAWTLDPYAIQDKNNNQLNEAKKAALQKMESNYQANLKKILNDYVDLAKKSSDLTTDTIEKVKIKLLGLRVPAKYKDVHLNLVLAFDKMETSLAKGSVNDLQSSQQIIEEIKNKNSWLN